MNYSSPFHHVRLNQRQEPSPHEMNYSSPFHHVGLNQRQDPPPLRLSERRVVGILIRVGSGVVRQLNFGDEDEFKTTFRSTVFSLLKDKKELRCPVCYEDFKSSTNVVKTSCDHVFCLTCLEKWKENSQSCPLCRTNIKKDAHVIVIE